MENYRFQSIVNDDDDADVDDDDDDEEESFIQNMWHLERIALMATSHIPS